MKSCLEFVTFSQAIQAVKIHLAEAKDHLKSDQLFDTKYELAQASIHLDMAAEILNSKRHSSTKVQ